MAQRINLSIDDDLFLLLQQDAAANGCTVNVYLITLLEKLYKQNPFDYKSALLTLEQEALSQPLGSDFTLCDLPSFRYISVVQAENANLQPSTIRARLGKIFNTKVREGEIGDVTRSTDSKGNLVYSSRTAVYRREPKENG